MRDNDMTELEKRLEKIRTNPSFARKEANKTQARTEKCMMAGDKRRRKYDKVRAERAQKKDP